MGTKERRRAPDGETPEPAGTPKGAETPGRTETSEGAGMPVSTEMMRTDEESTAGRTGGPPGTGRAGSAGGAMTGGAEAAGKEPEGREPEGREERARDAERHTRVEAAKALDAADARVGRGHAKDGGPGDRAARTESATAPTLTTATTATGYTDPEYAERPPLWVEEPADRRRLPDPVRTAAVRAVLIVSLTLILAMTAFFCTMAESWLAFPMVLSSVAGTVVATWSVCDVWVTRQVWNQRNGVVSVPSSTARRLRRERRRARRDARAAARSNEGIRGHSGTTGRLSHSQ